MKRGLRIALVFSLIMIIIGFLAYTGLKNKERITYNKYLSCEVDEDCIKVQEDCCGCNYGGKAIAINKGYKTEWIDSLNCKDIACIAMISNHWTCFAEPKCINNKCELVK